MFFLTIFEQVVNVSTCPIYIFFLMVAKINKQCLTFHLLDLLAKSDFQIIEMFYFPFVLPWTFWLFSYCGLYSLTSFIIAQFNSE